MKKLLAAVSVAALFTSAFAADEIEESDDVYEDVNKAVAEDVTDRPRVREAIWPAFFAFGDWPATPDLVGLRITIPYSTKQETVTGIDLGLWGASHDFEGAQLNIIRNKVRDTFGGVQVGLYNSVSRADLFSVQVGLWNEADSFSGLQVGLVNISGDVRGFQCGLINRSETLYGFQIGLINVIRDAELPVLPCINIGF